MMQHTSSQQSGGIGCFGVLTIIFVVLKLIGAINWSWWLVLLPFYAQLTVVILLAVVVASVRRR